MDKKEKRTTHSVINELVERTNSNTKRLRLLEQRVESMDSSMNIIEKDITEYAKDIKSLLQTLDKKLVTEDDKVIKVESNIKEIVTQLKKLATTADIRGLEELIDIYNPLKSNFITREEVEQVIEQKLINK